MAIDPMLLADAASSLRAAQDPIEGAEGMKRFMRAVEQLARTVEVGTATWGELGPWAGEQLETLLAAKPALRAWETEMGGMFYDSDGVESTEAALRGRSQHAFARELFNGTAADDMLAAFEDADVDEDFRRETERIGLSTPTYVPATHTWWHNR
jgi:hypothetical protein